MTSDKEPSARSPIRSEHLTKLAIVYIRQSSPEQVRFNTGSTQAQRDLTELPRRWGWREDLIRVIDDDLGLSGKFSHNRPGFREILDLTSTSRVGLVVVQDPSRLSRSPLDWERFLDAARRFGVLISTDDRVFDPDSAQLSELFGLRIKNLLAWYENEDRAARFRKATMAKAHRGFAVSRPPTGYVESVKGKWIKDTEPAIREAVDRVFRLALEQRSIRGAHREYRRQYRVFPIRHRGEIQWFPLNSATLSAMLANPNYCGDYVFNRRRALVHPSTGKQRLVSRPRGEWITYRDHHEPYISRQDWETLQESLAANRPTVRPPRGKGPALAQGLVRCGRCNRWLLTQYQSRDRRTRSMCYVCRRKDRWERWTIHNRINARVLDRFVVDQVLRALTTPQLEDALAAIQREEERRGGTERAFDLRVRHLEDAVRDAKRRYTHVDPENHHVRAQLEADLERLLCQLREAKLQVEAFEAKKEPRLTPEDAKQLVELGQQLPLLWNAHTTTNEDRKRLVRIALSEVVIHDVSKESVQLDLVWSGGLREAHRIPTRMGIQSLVEEWRHAGRENGAIIHAVRAMLALHGVNAQCSITRHFHKLGLDPKTEWKAALRIVQQKLLEGCQRREILAALTASDAPHVGPWTRQRLNAAIYRMRQGQSDVPALPQVLPEEQQKAKALELMHRRVTEGVQRAAIADELNELSIKPPRASQFTASLVTAWLTPRRSRRRITENL